MTSNKFRKRYKRNLLKINSIKKFYMRQNKDTMLGVLIGFAIGATIATNYNLIPVYEHYLKPGIDSGLQQIKEHLDKNTQDNGEEHK